MVPPVLGAHPCSGCQPRAGRCAHLSYFSFLKNLVGYVMRKFKSREVKMFDLWSQNQQRSVSRPWPVIPSAGGVEQRLGLRPGRAWNASSGKQHPCVRVCSSFRMLCSSSFLALASYSFQAGGFPRAWPSAVGSINSGCIFLFKLYPPPSPMAGSPSPEPLRGRGAGEGVAAGSV